MQRYRNINFSKIIPISVFSITSNRIDRNSLFSSDQLNKVKRFKNYNLIVGWFVFAIAAITYITTSEPTASLWDCSEFIATAFKLQVGHPPGAPLFMMIGRFFSLFAGSNHALVARMINTMSALASAF